jgi:hypothetical protein
VVFRRHCCRILLYHGLGFEAFCHSYGLHLLEIFGFSALCADMERSVGKSTARYPGFGWACMGLWVMGFSAWACTAFAQDGLASILVCIFVLSSMYIWLCLVQIYLSRVIVYVFDLLAGGVANLRGLLERLCEDKHVSLVRAPLRAPIGISLHCSRVYLGLLTLHKGIKTLLSSLHIHYRYQPTNLL